MDSREAPAVAKALTLSSGNHALGVGPSLHEMRAAASGIHEFGATISVAGLWIFTEVPIE